MRFTQYDARPKDYTIYLDLDGVLADFIRGINKVIDVEVTTHNQWSVIKKDKWSMVAKKGKDFWAHLPWMEDGRRLFHYVRNHKDLRILSAYPTHPDNIQPALQGKVAWVERELKIIPFDRVHLVSGRDKQRYAEPTAILIDDSERNIKQFIQMGGIGVLHTSAKDTIKQLKELGI